MPATDQRTCTPALHAAYWYASLGWSVVPARGKNPGGYLGKAWQLHATSDAETIAAWWDQWPAANVAIVPRDRQLVVDVDPRHGGADALAALEAEHEPLPGTLTVKTGGGGHHYYYYMCEPVPSVTVPALGVELRGGGSACVIGAGSIHPDTGQAYRRVQPVLPVATAPEWLEALIHAAPASVAASHVQPVRDPIRLRDERLVRRLDTYLHDAGPGGDVSAGGYRLACAALRGGLTLDQAAGLVQEHAELHGRDRKASRESYYARTVANAERAVSIDRSTA